jgi:hypothetical protein
MLRRLALGSAAMILAWTARGAGQSDAVSANSAPAPSSIDAEPIRHPVFVATTISGELGGIYAAGAKVAVLGNPVSSGISIGGSAFIAPLTGVTQTDGTPDGLDRPLFRFMAELRLGTAYSDHARGLGWLGLSAGVAYLDVPHMDPSPGAAIAAGGDLRLSRTVWIEFSPRLAWAQMIGPGSRLAGTYFTFGIEAGTRFDLTR